MDILLRSRQRLKRAVGDPQETDDQNLLKSFMIFSGVKGEFYLSPTRVKSVLSLSDELNVLSEASNCAHRVKTKPYPGSSFCLSIISLGVGVLIW